MCKQKAMAAAVLIVVATCCQHSFAQRDVVAAPAAPAAANKSTAEIAAAAQKLLSTLDEGQRAATVFDFKNEEQRKRWSNLPQSSFRREGLRMGDLTPPQREAALAVLKAALSAEGYEKVIQIVEADEVLKDGGGGGGGKGGKGGDGKGGKGGDGKGGDGKGGDGKGGDGKGGDGKGGKGGGKGGKGGGGGGANFGRDNYFIAFLGQPSATEPWTMQFGGHHLGINVTFVGEKSTLAPSHTGAQPAIYQLEGKEVRPLGREVEKSFALMSSLNEAERKSAILGFEVRDLVLGPGRDGQMIQPEGIKGADLTEKQREMLLDVASEWTGILHDAVAKAKMDEMKKNVNETWFAWSGPTEKDAPAYFRIQGPTVFIEFAPQRLGGDLSKHIHTIYRDPTNDYGTKWWKQ